MDTIRAGSTAPTQNKRSSDQLAVTPVSHRAHGTANPAAAAVSVSLYTLVPEATPGRKPGGERGGGGRRWVGQDGGARKQAARQGSLYEEPVMMWHDTPDDTHGPRVGQRNIKLN